MQTQFIILLFGVMSPLLIFAFRRSLLDKKSSWLVLMKISSVLAILGIVLTILFVGHENFYLGLIAP